MKKTWIRLDNAAKLFSTVTDKSDTQVFRLSCTLNSNIKPALLQKALNQTIQSLPVFQFVLKKGIFWYYLEKTNLQPKIEKEHRPPCSPILGRTGKSLLYEVTYYHNRINLEVYHVLADGSGAKFFLQTLIDRYLNLLAKKASPAIKTSSLIPKKNLFSFDISQFQMQDDSFDKYYQELPLPSPVAFIQDSAKLIRPPLLAAQVSGQKYNEHRLKIITGHLSVNQIHALAKKKGVTITTLLLAYLIQAIGNNLSTRAKKKPVIISVPVNLRQFFPSETLRNFFISVTVSYDFSLQKNSFSKILKKVDQDLKNNLNQDLLLANMAKFSAIENNFLIKIIPLFLKNLILKIVYKFVSNFQVTARLSNLGVVAFNSKAKNSQITSLDFLNGTNDLQVGVISYQDVLSISLVSPFLNTDISKDFFRSFTALGLDVKIFTNHLEP